MVDKKQSNVIKKGRGSGNLNEKMKKLTWNGEKEGLRSLRRLRVYSVIKWEGVLSDKQSLKNRDYKKENIYKVTL